MSYYYLQTPNDHLAHHGILGMRWGIRRYQPYEKGSKGGKEIGLAAKKSRGGSRRERREKKEMAKRQIEIIKQARAVKGDKEARAKILEEVKKHPTATAVLEFADELSTQELRDLNDRFRELKRLDDYAAMDSGFNAINSAMKKVDSVVEWGRTGVRGYTTAKEILAILDNTFDTSSKSKSNTGSKK